MIVTINLSAVDVAEMIRPAIRVLYGDLVKDKIIDVEISGRTDDYAVVVTLRSQPVQVDER